MPDDAYAVVVSSYLEGLDAGEWSAIRVVAPFSDADAADAYAREAKRPGVRCAVLPLEAAPGGPRADRFLRELVALRGRCPRCCGKSVDEYRYTPDERAGFADAPAGASEVLRCTCGRCGQAWDEFRDPAGTPLRADPDD